MASLPGYSGDCPPTLFSFLDRFRDSEDEEPSSDLTNRQFLLGFSKYFKYFQTFKYA